MREDYPTEQELEKLEKWEDFTQEGIKLLLDYIEDIWHWPDFGFIKKNGFASFNRKKCIKLQLHTGGWSGNEDIIQVLQKNLFWMLFWDASERGGHYYFEIRKVK